MRIRAAGFGLCGFFLWTLVVCAVVAQNQPPTHVIIPNPTPRPPDLKQDYGGNPKDQKKREALAIQSKLRAREIWLQSNQILLLAQQLQQEIHPGKNSASMTANAAKVGQIEKLAQSVQQKMRAQ
jgi:hypothetical protein